MIQLSAVKRKYFPEWKVALIGGVISIPFTLGYNMFTEPGYFSFTMVIIGGIVAGYLAQRNALGVYNAGMGAGAIGALPGLILVSYPLYNITLEWIAADSAILSIVIVPLAVLFLLGAGAVLGVVGAVIGGWLARKFDDQNSSRMLA